MAGQIAAGLILELAMGKGGTRHDVVIEILSPGATVTLAHSRFA